MLRFLRPEEVYLLVIDPQEKLMAVIHEAERVSKNICLLLRLAQTLDLPVLPTTQYVKGLGPYVPEIQALVKEEILDKMEFSVFKNETIAR